MTVFWPRYWKFALQPELETKFWKQCFWQREKLTQNFALQFLLPWGGKQAKEVLQYGKGRVTFTGRANCAWCFSLFIFLYMEVITLQVSINIILTKEVGGQGYQNINARALSVHKHHLWTGFSYPTGSQGLWSPKGAFSSALSITLAFRTARAYWGELCVFSTWLSPPRLFLQLTGAASPEKRRMCNAILICAPPVGPWGPTSCLCRRNQPSHRLRGITKSVF